MSLKVLIMRQISFQCIKPSFSKGITEEKVLALDTYCRRLLPTPLPRQPILINASQGDILGTISRYSVNGIRSWQSKLPVKAWIIDMLLWWIQPLDYSDDGLICLTDEEKHKSISSMTYLEYC